MCGETLRLLRAIKGIKQETIAKKLGISQPAYSKIEKRDCINGWRGEQLLTALNCTRDELEWITKNHSLTS